LVDAKYPQPFEPGKSKYGINVCAQIPLFAQCKLAAGCESAQKCAGCALILCHHYLIPGARPCALFADHLAYEKIFTAP
jgi:hypothetical protein